MSLTVRDASKSKRPFGRAFTSMQPSSISGARDCPTSPSRLFKRPELAQHIGRRQLRVARQLPPRTVATDQRHLGDVEPLAE